MKVRAAVIGQPISHSLSPALFSLLAEKRGLDLEYRAEAVAAEDLQSRITEFKKSYVGVNVTIPHKEDVLPLVDSQSSVVQALGAANVIKFTNQLATAHNTDVEGISASWLDQSLDVKNKNILIIGAGGAARAAAYSAGKAHAKNIFIYNRNFKRSQDFISHMSPLFKATQFRSIAVGRTEKFIEPLELVVNATPLGMSGFDSGSDYFKEIFQHLNFKPQWAFDLIYKPEVTPFLMTAKQNGARVFGGLDMFIYQALATWKLWFEGPGFDREIKEELSHELRRILRA